MNAPSFNLTRRNISAVRIISFGQSCNQPSVRRLEFPHDRRSANAARLAIRSPVLVGLLIRIFLPVRILAVLLFDSIYSLYQSIAF